MTVNLQNSNNDDRSVISTQPVEQAAKLKSALEGTNFTFFSLPMIKIQTVQPNTALQHILDHITDFDHILFTSKNGVLSLAKLLQPQQKKLLNQIPVSVIGQGTASALNQINVKPLHINPGNTGVDFAQYLLSSVIKENERVLLVQGELAPDFLEKELARKAHIKRINVYQTLPCKDADNTIISKIKADQYGLLVVTSPSAFENLTKYINPEKQQLRILSIGATTTAAIRAVTNTKVITATKPGTNYLKEKIIQYFN